MPGLRFIDYLKPIVPLIPDVVKPTKKIILNDKLIWTAITLFIYLVCSQIPVYGVQKGASGDPLYWIRVILASNKGSLMELGISPIVTSSMIMQLLAGVKLISVDQNDDNDRVLFNAAQKFLGLLITIGEAVGYVLSGMYGDVQQIGVPVSILIIVQLVAAGVLVILLDELMQKGWGIGSGISLFIATNICENIVWKAFSPITLSHDASVEYEGAIISLFHTLITKPNKLQAIQHAFLRPTGPNLFNLMATLLVFLIVIYFQGFRVELNLTHKKASGAEQKYPIKLFYTSNIPIILQTALVANLYFISQIIYKRFKGNFLVNFIGTWQEQEAGGQSYPTGGLAYYISPPRDFTDFISDPIHCLFYISFVLIICSWFSRLWIDVSGQSSRDVAKQLKDQGMGVKSMSGKGDLDTLNRYIPIAAIFGGFCIGALTIIADLLGAIGSGTGILLAVTIIYQYIETINKLSRQGESILG